MFLKSKKGTLLTPSAKQFLNEKGIRLVIKGEEAPVQLNKMSLGKKQKKKSSMKSQNMLEKMENAISKNQNI